MTSQFKKSLIACAALCVWGAAPAIRAQGVVYPTVGTNVQPSADPFYISPDVDVLAAVTPGTVLRYRALPRAAVWSNVKAGWQLMYRSNDIHMRPIAMVTTLFVPQKPLPSGGRLLSYQSFYDSLTLNCSPSGIATSGKLVEGMFFSDALDKGYHVVMSDYEGLDSQWMVGAKTAHGVLDGIRAATRFSQGGLRPDTPVGLMGYSGGGHASVWGAEAAPSYAPELNIVGAAAGGVAVNPKHVILYNDGGSYAAVSVGMLVGMMRAYPDFDVKSQATAAGLAALNDVSQRCIGGPLSGNPTMLSRYAGKSLRTYFSSLAFLDSPGFQVMDEAGTLGRRRPAAPLRIWHGKRDEALPMADVDALVRNYCRQGATVEYIQLNTTHVPAAFSMTTGLRYLDDRMSGKAPPSTCP
jgi:Secretory lipase